MELLIKKPELQALAGRILRGLATQEDLRRASLDDVRAIKTDTGELHYRMTAEPVERKASEPDRSRRYVASDETVDRMGDIILVKGWDLATYKKNPQALWAHDARAFPIGTVTEIEKGMHRGSPALLETINYLEEGLNPAADIVWRLVDQGVVRAVSVGFLPVKARWPESEEERQELGLGEWGVLYEKQEQLELSNCTVPANPNALATKSVQTALRDMVKRGEITERDAESVIELGSARKIAVQVPDLDGLVDEAQAEHAAGLTEPVTSTTSGNNVFNCRFVVSKAGKLTVVTEEAVTEVAEDDAPDADEPTVEERLTAIEGQLALLVEEVRGLAPQVQAAVGQSLRGRKRDLTRTLELIVQRAGERFAQESS